MMASLQLHLAAFMRPISIHTGAWRYPGGTPDANFNFRAIVKFAQRLEAARFDAFFMADHLALLNMPMDALKRSATATSFEPFTLLSAPLVKAVLKLSQYKRADEAPELVIQYSMMLSISSSRESTFSG